MSTKITENNKLSFIILSFKNKKHLTYVSITTKFQKYIKNMIMHTQAANVSGFRIVLPPAFCFFCSSVWLSEN